jgi:hypothetical protein
MSAPTKPEWMRAIAMGETEKGWKEWSEEQKDCRWNSVDYIEGEKWHRIRVPHVGSIFVGRKPPKGMEVEPPWRAELHFEPLTREIHAALLEDAQCTAMKSIQQELEGRAKILDDVAIQVISDRLR